MSDLEYERQTAEKAGLVKDAHRLACALNGGEQAFNLSKRLNSYLESDPVISDWYSLFFLSREKALERAVEVIGRLYRIKADHNLSASEFDVLQRSLTEDTPLTLQQWVYVVSHLNQTTQVIRSNLHVISCSFIPCLKALADSEQLKEWLPHAESYSWLGCYAQTELAHGSNVAAIQTTATYLPQFDEFEIYTPTLEATKWWVGHMGKLATHAVLFAQLVLPDGSCKGPHPFLVPIRSLEDHRPLPGIEVGDIGPKMGFAAVDNGATQNFPFCREYSRLIEEISIRFLSGFLRLNKVRIARRNMLARYSHVTQDGRYVQAPNQKLLYGSMLAVRSGLVRACSAAAAVTATIAVRYSAVRRQFSDHSGAREKQILDHRMQQYRILPAVAYSYALTFCADWMDSRFAQMNTEFAAGDFRMLAAMHATTSALKSFCTSSVGKLIEQCRLACGGHGYSVFSGLPGLYSTFSHMETAEGEAALLTQQVGRHLLKLFQAYFKHGRLSSVHPFDPANDYFNGDVVNELSSVCGLAATAEYAVSFAQYVLPAFKHRSVRLLAMLAEKLQSLMGAMSHAQAWNECHVEIFRLSAAHAAYIVLKTSERAMAELQTASELVPALWELLAIFWIHDDSGSWLEDGYISPIQMKYVRGRLNYLLPLVRRGSVSLVDCFSHTDRQLHSALGVRDGHVYERLFDLASRHNPVNKQPTVAGFEKHIQPFIHAKL